MVVVVFLEYFEMIYAPILFVSILQSVELLSV